jgi:ABC-type nitrate/sulfonate/bicarbonate transport system permease component
MTQPTRDPGSRSDIAWKWGLRLCSLSIFLSGWEVFALSRQSLLFPSFSQTLAVLLKLLISSDAWQALWLSNQALLAGYLCAVTVGVPLGLLLGRSPRTSRFVDVYLNVFMAIPKSAIIPLIVLATGVGLFSRVLSVFSFSVAYIVVNTQTGIQQIDTDLVEMARSFGATERQLWAKIFLPAAIPAIASGLYLGLGRAISGMVNVELLLVAVGVGRLILQYQGDFESEGVYAVVLIVMGEAVLLMRTIKRLVQRMGLSESETTIQ